jgi:hypothetical protein
MNPGDDIPDQPNARRKINYECMFCHNSYPEIPAGHEQIQAEPRFAGSLHRESTARGATVRDSDMRRLHAPRVLPRNPFAAQSSIRRG